MYRFRAVGPCLAALALTGGLFMVLPPAAAAPPADLPAAPARQAGEASSCQPQYSKVAYPKVILLGEEVAVTLTVKAVCAGERMPMHIVLVLDASGSMGGAPVQEMKTAASLLVRDLELRDYPSTRIGIVEFSTVARTLSLLTNDEGQALGAIARIRAGGGTAIDAGIVAGLKVLQQGGSKSRDVTEAMVVLSDGANNAGPDPVLAAARQAKAQGILMIAVCVGPACDTQLMRQVASRGDYYFQAASASALKAVFQRIRDRLLNISLRKLRVKDTLPPYVEYVAGSAVPEPKEPGTIGAWLLWEDAHVPREGVTYTLRVRPKRVGYMPTNVEGWGELTDNKGRTREWLFQVPWVTVLSPSPLVTPVAPPPTPTNPPTPSATPTLTSTPIPSEATPTPTPTGTPTPRPKPLYLPIVLTEHCETDKSLADVVLVLDMSTSMRFPTPIGRSKLEAVVEAAHYFVDQMELTPNEKGRRAQAAVAGFNDDAWIQVALTNDRRAIQQGIDDLPKGMKEGTRLDKAFMIGAEALASPKRDWQHNMAVMILLTDGLPNRVPAAEDGSMNTTVIRAAEAVKAAGTAVYTIAVGYDSTDVPLIYRIDAALMTTCATRARNFYHDPTGEQLASVYAEIWRELDPCGGRHDWGKPWRPDPWAGWRP